MLTPQQALADIVRIADQVPAAGEVHRHLAQCAQVLAQALATAAAPKGNLALEPKD